MTHSENPVLRHWFGYVVLAGVAIAASIGLYFLRPDLFAVQQTLPATIIYFALFWFVLRSIGSRKSKSKANLQTKPLSKWQEGLAEFGMFFAFLIVGTIVGCISGLVWWGAGGYELRTIEQALKIGAILGATTIVLLFGGA